MGSSAQRHTKASEDAEDPEMYKNQKIIWNWN